MAIPPVPLRVEVVDPMGRLVSIPWAEFFRQLVAQSESIEEEVTALSGPVGLIGLDSQIRRVTGSRGSPTSIVAGTGITPLDSWEEVIFVQGSGGAVDISANPQIAAGGTAGQTLILIGRSNTNTLTLEDGTGLSMNGPITLEADDMIAFIWDGTNWVEMWRKDAA